MEQDKVLAVEGIIKRMRAAFASVKEPEMVSDGCPRPVCVELEARFKDKRSRDRLSARDIEILSSELTIINDDAFRFFLPMVLESALKDKASVNMDMLIMNISCYPEQGQSYDFNKKRLNGLDTAQSDVILDIIDLWIADVTIGQGWRDDLSNSLGYWRKRAKRG
jgi:hypothetical protein